MTSSFCRWVRDAPANTAEAYSICVLIRAEYMSRRSFLGIELATLLRIPRRPLHLITVRFMCSLKLTCLSTVNPRSFTEGRGRKEILSSVIAASSNDNFLRGALKIMYCVLELLIDNPL